ncbi:MAG TPA: sigma-70 family RNA polymerase sigma factor [Candidatus Methylomirabilis sp.]|nr:sigma-70 family RNA polymerase sigma factor [Candidatus Methylomirabilis sp.]
MSNLALEGEPALLDASRAGDSRTMEELIRRHQARLFGFVLRMCRNADDAQDVLQETFLGMIRSIHEFRGECKFTTWLFQIAFHVCLKRRRRGLFEPKPEQELSLDDLLPSPDTGGQRLDIADWSENAERTLLRAELFTRVEAAIERLPQRYRVVLLLRDVEGMSTEEAAEVLLLSIPAVKSRLHRARLFVRRELAYYFRDQVRARSSSHESLVAAR